MMTVMVEWITSLAVRRPSTALAAWIWGSANWEWSAVRWGVGSPVMGLYLKRSAVML